MIVNREHALAAMAVLEITLPLEEVERSLVDYSFKVQARKYHPDMPTGDAAAFVEADRAKAILELWLARQPADVPKGLVPTACARCRGVGRMRVNKGFNSYVVRCNTCNGTGDGSYDHDRSKE